jgi:hypothetical protein
MTLQPKPRTSLRAPRSAGSLSRGLRVLGLPGIAFLLLFHIQTVGNATDASAGPINTPAQELETNSTTATDRTNLWAVDVAPYLWLAGYDGTFGLPTLPAGIPSVHTDSADVSTARISAAAMLSAQIHYRDLGLFFDGAWLQLKADGGPPNPSYSGTEVKSDFAYGTFAGSYRLPPLGQLQSDLFAGARVWYVSTEIELLPGSAPGITGSKSRTWADPVLGALLRYQLTRRWYGLVLGDVGGFGVGSQISWSVFGGVGYRFTNWFSAIVGYRYMHIDYDHDQFLMNINVQGLLLGLGFHF